MSKPSIQAESRRHYRIQYPSALRPQLCIAGARLAVIDLCEKGLRFAGGHTVVDEVGAKVDATLRFRNGEMTVIHGSVVRITERDIAISLEPGFSFLTIVREQRRLLAAAPYAVH